MIALLPCSAFAAVVGSGTPSSCTEAALASAVAGGGTVTFNCGAGPQSIPFTFPLSFSQNNAPVTIDGGDTITLDGTGLTSGMIFINGSDTSLANVTFKHITFANGSIAGGLQAGGTIQNFGKLTLDSVTIRNGHANGTGAIFQEPCTGCLTPSLTATNCLFKDNNAGSGAAIGMEGGIAVVVDSTFTGNSAPGAAAIEIYSNSTFTVDMTIERCTFNGNTATAWGGGAIAIDSLNAGSNVRIANCTFTGNSVAAAGHGSALYISASPVTITNCTIAGNSAGAVYFDRAAAMNNTIIASNGGSNCVFASGATFTGGHNLQFGDSTCTGVAVADPLLSALADNGGATKTMAIASTSPAVNAADPALAPTTDQRGVPRGSAADIGAFELQPPLRHRSALH